MTESYRWPIVGMRFRPPALAILQVLPIDCPLWLVPEPSNPYDSNALQVVVSSDSIPSARHADLAASAEGFGFDLADILAEGEWHLGYIAKEFAAKVALPDRVPCFLTFSAEGAPRALVEIADCPLRD